MKGFQNTTIIFFLAAGLLSSAAASPAFEALCLPLGDDEAAQGAAEGIIGQTISVAVCRGPLGRPGRGGPNRTTLPALER